MPARGVGQGGTGLIELWSLSTESSSISILCAPDFLSVPVNPPRENRIAWQGRMDMLGSCQEDWLGGLGLEYRRLGQEEYLK